MSTTSREQLLLFVNRNLLKREDGIICFTAAVQLFDITVTHFKSEIHVIQLPKEHALYIIDRPVNLADRAGMYSTLAYSFVCTKSNTLEINNGEQQLLIITPNKP